MEDKRYFYVRADKIISYTVHENYITIAEDVGYGKVRHWYIKYPENMDEFKYYIDARERVNLKLELSRKE